ncbi:hypothetical protein IMZ29_19210 [Achromobacter sp. GG226]|uniref:hypothetical protein n=1 Tax=Verticiella alkaliphila TaxID=2779529 RepID=UPI001C0CC818|nr:hypothetical protein [Verticiella sp. GG226]MBU4612594.1 hypothetical protein [Verticiella sp. GG226]
MPLDHDRQERLQQLLLNDPQLLADVRDASDATQAASLLAQAATTAGIAVSAPELQAHVDALSPTDLTDDALADVAGGLTQVGRQFLTLFTLGLGCALYDVKQANKPDAH